MTDVIHSNNDNPEFDYSLHTPVMVADIIKNMPKNF
jgi:hypothetical protein